MKAKLEWQTIGNKTWYWIGGSRWYRKDTDPRFAIEFGRPGHFDDAYERRVRVDNIPKEIREAFVPKS